MWHNGKESTHQCKRHRFDPWRRKWQPTPVFLPGESHGQRSLAGYSPRGFKESDTTEHTHRHWSRVDPNPMPSVLIRRENRHGDIQIQREDRSEIEGCSCKPRIASSHQNSGGRCGLDSLSEPSEGADPAKHLDLRPLASRMGREYASVALAFPPCPELPPHPLVCGPLVTATGNQHNTY